MKVLITGGTGFQGSNLAKSLLDDGHQVRLLNLYSEKSKTNVEIFKLKEAEVVWGTINDIHTVEECVRDVDIIVHCAAKIHVDESIDEPAKFYLTNVMGTNNVLECARRYNIPFMHISTCEVYGYQAGVLKEDAPLLPRSPYASSKAGADRMVYSYNTTYGMNNVILRPFNVYGIGQKDGKAGAVIPIWATQVLKELPILIYGTGQQSREFIYIDDLVRAYRIIIDKMLSTNELAGKVINIGTEEDITVNDLAKLVVDTSETDVKTIYGRPRPGEVKRFLSDSSYMRSLGWEPKVSMEEGMKKYINWRKERNK